MGVGVQVGGRNGVIRGFGRGRVGLGGRGGVREGGSEGCRYLTIGECTLMPCPEEFLQPAMHICMSATSKQFLEPSLI